MHEIQLPSCHFHLFTQLALARWYVIISACAPIVFGTRNPACVSFQNVMQKIKEVGVLYNHRKQMADDRTLESLKFQIGDYLDVAM